MAKERYQWENKNSRHLARILQKKSRNYIEKNQNGKGEMVHTTKEIGESFKNYYKDLYSVGNIGGQTGEKRIKIVEFLKKAKLPKIAESCKDNLESPITEDQQSFGRLGSGEKPRP